MVWAAFRPAKYLTADPISIFSLSFLTVSGTPLKFQLAFLWDVWAQLRSNLNFHGGIHFASEKLSFVLEHCLELFEWHTLDALIYMVSQFRSRRSVRNERYKSRLSLIIARCVCWQLRHRQLRLINICSMATIVSVNFVSVGSFDYFFVRMFSASETIPALTSSSIENSSLIRSRKKWQSGKASKQKLCRLFLPLLIQSQ